MKIPQTNPNFFVKNENGGCIGHVNDFSKFPLINFEIPPFSFNTHHLGMHDWIMKIKQRNNKSSMILNFHNHRNFGFTVKLTGKNYKSLEEIFEKLEIFQYEMEILPYKLNDPLFHVIHHKPKFVTNQITQISDLSEVCKDTQKQIMNEIGDYRKPKPSYQENVINFEDYLKEPKSNNFNLEEILKEYG